MGSYSDLLKDPRWQKKRLEILGRDNFTCQSCGSTTKTLHVHHHYYINGRMPWEYNETLLITLCYDCHEVEEGMKQLDEDYIRVLLSCKILRIDIESLVNTITCHLNKDCTELNMTPKDTRARFTEMLEVIHN